eukprot:3144278-Pyramimonas_sp.AAC.1
MQDTEGLRRLDGGSGRMTRTPGEAFRGVQEGRVRQQVRELEAPARHRSHSPRGGDRTENGGDMAMTLLAHMHEEVYLLDQLGQEIQSQGWSGSRETYANGNADVEIVPGEDGS